MTDMRVYRVNLDVTDAQIVHLPSESRILSVQENRGELSLWALVDIHQPDVKRWVYVVGTGNPIDFDPRTSPYFGTVQMDGGRRGVWHVFVGREFGATEDAE